MLSRLRARMLLDQCTGRDIWPVEHCREQGVPDAWIDELADTYESGFRHDRQTIYYNQRVTNQFHGVHDLLLARKLAELLDVDTGRVASMAFNDEAEVRALREEADE